MQIGCRKQLIHIALAACARSAPLHGGVVGLAVIRHTPACIPGHTKAGDRLACQQGLKTHGGADHIHLAHLLDEGEWIHRLAQHHHAFTVLHSSQVATFTATAYFRVGFHINGRLRVFIQRGLQHVCKTLRTGAAQSYAHISRRLVNHQHALRITRTQGIWRQVWRMVVFAQAGLQQSRTRLHRAAARACQHIHRACQQLLQRTGLGAVVVNTCIVYHQRQAGRMCPCAKGAYKTIF